MRTDLLEIGDEVVIEVAWENRKWGFNPCPDGTHAKVVSFGEIPYGRLDNYGRKPGVYENHHWVYLLLGAGKEICLGTFHIEGLADKAEHQRREERPYHERNVFLRELPETPFWESDVVRTNDGTTLTVVRISYDALEKKTHHGFEYPAYDLSDTISAGWRQSFPAGELKLVRRGPVWDIAHGIPVTFGSLEEEARLAMRMGLTEEIRNPASNNYAWTKDEVLGAIRSGLAHGFMLGGGLGFLGGPNTTRHSAIVFQDVELGKRVATQTIAGFS